MLLAGLFLGQKSFAFFWDNVKREALTHLPFYSLFFSQKSSPLFRAKKGKGLLFILSQSE